MKKVNWLKEDESGQGIIEYALILAGIALAVVAAVLFLGQHVSNFFTSFGNTISHPGTT